MSCVSIFKWQSKVSHCRNFMKPWTWWNYVLWVFIFILGGMRLPQPSEIAWLMTPYVIQTYCIENAWNVCQRLLGQQNWHLVLALNLVVPAFLYTLSSIPFILNVSLWSEEPLHNNREKNHIIMYNDRMYSHYILCQVVGVQSLYGWMKLTWLSLLKCWFQTFVMHGNIHTLREILCYICMEECIN